MARYIQRDWLKNNYASSMRNFKKTEFRFLYKALIPTYSININLLGEYVNHRNLQIKALIEGLDANFEDFHEVDEFAEILKSVIENNPHYTSSVVGDADGLLISDKNDIPVLTVIFSLNKIKFHTFFDAKEYEQHQAEIISRVVLASIAQLLCWYGDKYLVTDPEDLKKLLPENNAFLNPALNPRPSIKTGDILKFEFVNDGFGLY